MREQLARVAPLPRLAMSVRDARILALARAKLHGSRVAFADAIRALNEAVREEILDGRIYHLGLTTYGPILGSIISGIGIVDGPLGVELVRAKPGDLVVPGGLLLP
ncbi:MAG: hypothetical protein SFX73_22815 [Kofleriaceae bacterium]|nr:hypothetical protein [Kofleriaceae bacterium]